MTTSAAASSSTSRAASALVGFVAALAVLDAERDAPNASITTVGYGDRYPVTGEGRIVGGALMLGGIALLGVVTASIASWFVETVRATGEEVAREAEQDTERQAERTSAQLDAVLAELRALHARLDVLEAARTVGVPRQDDTRLAGGHCRS